MTGIVEPWMLLMFLPALYYYINDISTNQIRFLYRRGVEFDEFSLFSL